MLSQLLTHLDLQSSDRDQLRRMGRVLEPRVAEIVQDFYRPILEDPETRAIVESHSSVDRLRGTLARWLQSVFAAPHDDAYSAARQRIGQVHVDIGLTPRHMVTAMNNVRRSCQRVLDEAGSWSPEAAKALGKALDLDLALMLESWAGHREEQAVRDARSELFELYDSVFDHAHAFILQLDAQLQVTATNRWVLQACNVERQSFLGTPLAQHLADEDRAEVAAALAPVIRGEETVAMFECRMVRTGGGFCSVAWTAAAVPGTSPRHLVVVGVDIGERSVLEARAREAERMAAIGQMAATLAHEVRNPLNSAVLQLRVLRKALARTTGDGAPRASSATEIIEAEIRRLGSLVTEFLDYSRPSQLREEAVAVQDLVADILPPLREEAKLLGISISLDIPTNLPSLHVDRAKMHQVLQNVLRNALEALAERKGNVSIRAERRSGPWLCLAVEDDGPGIDASRIDQVFEPFVTTKAKGTGLGLAVVRKIVGDHGGRVSLANTEPNGGACVCLHLPLSTE